MNYNLTGIKKTFYQMEDVLGDDIDIECLEITSTLTNYRVSFAHTKYELIFTPIKISEKEPNQCRLIVKSLDSDGVLLDVLPKHNVDIVALFTVLLKKYDELGCPYEVDVLLKSQWFNTNIRKIALGDERCCIHARSLIYAHDANIIKLNNARVQNGKILNPHVKEAGHLTAEYAWHPE